MKNWYVREHRMIMSDYLWRKLKDNEVVHHIDWVKSNNDINNLEVMEWWEHSSNHHKWIEKAPDKKNQCIFPNCIKKTLSKIWLCTFHYKLQRSRVKAWNISNLTESFYVELNSKGNKRWVNKKQNQDLLNKD
jgi:hypothetical protein